MKFVPHTGELFKGQGELKQSAKSLSPVRGSYSLGCSKKESSPSSLSPVRGSYSYPATMIPKLPEFVLHVGELFCVIWITRKNISLSPARGSYSYDAIEVGKVLQFIPVRGSYFETEAIPRIELVCPPCGELF